MIRKILSNFQKTTASSAAWQNSREFNRHYCEFIKSFHTNKTLKVKGIFEFTLDHDLWKMPVPGHTPLYIHTTKVEFDKPDKTENKQKKMLDRPLFFGEALIYAKNIIVCKKKKTKNEHCNITILLLLLSSNSKKEKLLLLLLLQTQHRSKTKKQKKKIIRLLKSYVN